jgi:hypothetical protein
MADPDLDLLQTAIKRRWSRVPSSKAKRYVNAFLAAERRGTKITAWNGVREALTGPHISCTLISRR